LTKTSTYTPASCPTSGGGDVLKIKMRCDTMDEGTTMDFYSGPLVATGIGSTQWTFSVMADSEDIIFDTYVNTYNEFINGITLTGTPTSIRLYLTSEACIYSSTTKRGRGRLLARHPESCSVTRRERTQTSIAVPKLRHP